MKTLFKNIKTALLAVSVGSLLMLGACTDMTEGDSLMGEGTVSLSVAFDQSLATRAESPVINSIEVANAKGVIRSWSSVEEIPAELVLTSGEYTVSVDAGVAESAGWNGAHYSGSSSFVVSAGSNEQVDVVCTIDNTLVGVAFDESVTSLLTDYAVTVAVDNKNSVVFDADNEGAVAYITPAENDTDFEWSFSAKTLDGVAVSGKGTVKDIKPRTKYTLNISFNRKPLGEAVISIRVVDSSEEVKDVFDIYGRPEIKALDFDMSVAQQARPEPFTLRAKAPNTIVSLAATSEIYGEEPIELLGWTSGGGVVVTQVNEAEYTVALDAEYVAALPSGVTTITLTVVDEKDNTAAVSFSFLKAGVSAVDAWDVWATKTTVEAEMPQVENAVQFGYGVNDEWTMVDGVYAGGKYTANLTGLTPSTTYNVQLFVNGVVSGDPITITTEAAPQISNGGFENWNKNGKTWYPYASGEPYWDSGNPGATTLGDKWNITISSEDPRPGSSGKLCARMQSAYPSLAGIGKFAAGNLYVGRFAGLDGMNGTVEFGQPFTGRPTALRGWFKCNVGQINKSDSSAPVTSGPDRYQIMICLMTGTHRVNTADKSTFFNCKTDSKVVAWGEILGNESVGEWTEFTLPLNYVKEGVRPTHITIVTTASSYGDYFTGSTDSWMCVDDFELIY